MSKRKGPLSKVDKFYIDNNPDLTAEELASDLDRSVNAVCKHLLRNGLQSKAKSKHVSAIKKDDTTTVVGDLLVSKTASQRKGVTVMTPAASELSDEVKATPQSKINTSVVHRIKK